MSPPRSRRILSLWLPRLSAERALRHDGTASCAPFAVIAESRGALALVGPCARAEALGLRAGMVLADARAIAPELRTAMWAAGAEARFRAGLLRWSGRWTPWASLESGAAPQLRGTAGGEAGRPEGSGGLALDITGCAHLFGGEREMAARMIEDLATLGLTAQAGIADTRGGAWALARHGVRFGVASGRAASGRSGDDVGAEAPATRVRSARRHGSAGGRAIEGAARAVGGAAAYAVEGAAALGGVDPPRSARAEDGPPPCRDVIAIQPPGAPRQTLAPLPIAALRMPEATAQALARLGLTTIGDLMGMPRAALARRFGADLMLRLDQALGVTPEPVSPIRHAPPLSARLTLPEPIGLRGDLDAAFARVLAALCVRLDAQGLGARRVRFSIRRADGGGQVEEIGLARPSRDPERIGRLLDGIVARFDAGFGIDAVRAEAVQAEPLSAVQHSGHAAALSEAQSRVSPGAAPPPSPDMARDMSPGGGEAFAELLGRLGARIGLERLLRYRAADSHIPEKTAHLASAAHAPPQPPGWPGPGRPRPILLWSPEPIAPLAPGRPPAAFRWRRGEHVVALAEGPERIAPEWWLDDPAWRSGPRDYWRVETADGRRIWLFEALGAEMPGGWFVHGPMA
ncbi:MAG: protein ImuB [Paracoccaceae bacterium]|jgi:protein ImuB